MKVSRRSVRRFPCRAILGLLAITWLPYVSTRCIAPLDGGCPMLPAASGDVHAHSHDHSRGVHEAMPPGSHDEHDGSPPGHTCCELTGQYAYTVASSPPTVARAAVLVTMPTPARTPTGLVADRLNHLSPEPAQHPPPYLRFLALLI